MLLCQTNNPLAYPVDLFSLRLLTVSQLLFIKPFTGVEGFISNLIDFVRLP